VLNREHGRSIPYRHGISPKNKISSLSAKAYRNARKARDSTPPSRDQHHRRWHADHPRETLDRVSAAFSRDRLDLGRLNIRSPIRVLQ
jgi:hypothetical protein